MYFTDGATVAARQIRCSKFSSGGDNFNHIHGHLSVIFNATFLTVWKMAVIHKKSALFYSCTANVRKYGYLTVSTDNWPKILGL